MKYTETAESARFVGVGSFLLRPPRTPRRPRAPMQGAGAFPFPAPMAGQPLEAAAAAAAMRAARPPPIMTGRPVDPRVKSPHGADNTECGCREGRSSEGHNAGGG